MNFFRLGTAAIGVLAFAVSASAATFNFSVGTCVAEDSTSLSRIRYTAGRIWSTGGSANVICPLSAHASDTEHTTFATMRYVDNSNNDISCTYYWTDFSGDEVWSW